MKTLDKILKESRFLSVLVLCLSSLLMLSCGGDDDEDSDSPASNSVNDYIEITVDGKTYSREFFPVYSEMDLDDNYRIVASTVDMFYDEDFEVFFYIFSCR